MVKRLIQLEVVMLLLLTLFAGCSTPTSAPPTVQPAVPTNTPVPPTETPEPPTPTPEPTATPIPPTPTKVPSFSGKVDVGGYQLSIRCIGEGEPTVVFDSGGGWDKSEWNFAFAENPTDMGIRLCSYDRAGMGRSNVSPDKPRTNMHMAVDLHNLLINANIEKPYVLVGHSLGGFTMRVFAHQYPDEVVGMVLVDSACVGEIERVLALLPPESADELNGITTLRNWYITILEEPLKAGEFWDYPTSSEYVGGIDSYGDLPLVILTRDVIGKEAQIKLVHFAYGPDFPVDLIEKFEKDWLPQQEALKTLSTNSTHIIVEGTSHLIPTEKPEAVVDAIRIVLEQVRGQ